MDTVIAGFIALFCSVVGAWVGINAALKATKKEVKDETKETTACNTKLEMKMDYVSTGIDDIKLDFRELGRRVNGVNERLIRTEEKYDNISERVRDLEAIINKGGDLNGSN